MARLKFKIKYGYWFVKQYVANYIYYIINKGNHVYVTKYLNNNSESPSKYPIGNAYITDFNFTTGNIFVEYINVDLLNWSVAECNRKDLQKI